ncbi:8974_t:CDS:2 [Cetraspora pellucida]|uniref:8974_t:CDS:1 n=1 Tax=Cetraspora pellucida TaxID=1433469 RepID=A0A9N9N4D8_9GLOM|nr:8974_t:CDS:2 [Cetraspora pellucida]
MTSLPTDSFKISITTTTTTELNTLTSQPSQPTSSPEPEITITSDVATPENITNHNSQISALSLYANQELNRSATSISTVDYIVPSNDPRNSAQIFKLQTIDYSNFVGISPLGYGKSITILVSTWKNDKDMTKVALKRVESLAAFSQVVKEDSNDNENKSLIDNHPHNILLHNERLMISDLGISKSIPHKSSVYPSLPYIDPNYFASPTTYPRDKHLDIYSLSVIMHDVSSGKRPFENLPYNQFLAIRLLEGLGRLKLDPVWVDNDEIMGNNGKKNFVSNLEFNNDIKGIIMESKHPAFGTGSVTFSNGNITSIRDIEINENEIYGEEEKDERTFEFCLNFV